MRIVLHVLASICCLASGVASAGRLAEALKYFPDEPQATFAIDLTASYNPKSALAMFPPVRQTKDYLASLDPEMPLDDQLRQSTDPLDFSMRFLMHDKFREQIDLFAISSPSKPSPDAMRSRAVFIGRFTQAEMLAKLNTVGFYPGSEPRYAFLKTSADTGIMASVPRDGVLVIASNGPGVAALLDHDGSNGLLGPGSIFTHATEGERVNDLDALLYLDGALTATVLRQVPVLTAGAKGHVLELSAGDPASIKILSAFADEASARKASEFAGALIEVSKAAVKSTPEGKTAGRGNILISEMTLSQTSSRLQMLAPLRDMPSRDEFWENGIKGVLAQTVERKKKAAAAQKAKSQAGSESHQ